MVASETVVMFPAQDLHSILVQSVLVRRVKYKRGTGHHLLFCFYTSAGFQGFMTVPGALGM